MSGRFPPGVGSESPISGEQIYGSHDLKNSNVSELNILFRVTKRSVDIGCALAFFVLFGWLYLLLWCGVMISSGRPVLYSQLRYGRDGRVFKFYKFRSMISNSDVILKKHLESNPLARKEWAEFQKLVFDPRITRFGTFIRKTSLDELPQFWNVLVGDMSLVGPRPCMLNQKDLYGAHWHVYCAVRPGITGLWQVSGRNKLSYNQRVALDVKYVENLSLVNDMKILVRTALVVLTGHGSR